MVQRRFTLPRTLSAFAALATVLAVGLLSTGTASAQSPPGTWTQMRTDAFQHYACKARQGGRLVVRTATWFNGDSKAVGYGIGAYAAAARGSNGNVVASQDSTAWRGGYIKLQLAGVRQTDRIWMQGSYYGPPAPWSKGVPVSRIIACGAVKAQWMAVKVKR